MKMDNYITVQRKNSNTLLLHCDFGCGTYMHFQIDEWDTETDFPYYTAHAVGTSFACLQFPLPLWDRETLEEKRANTVYYDFYATTLQDIVHELVEAYKQYLIELEAI